MRSLLFFCELAALLPIAFARPFVGVLIFSFISFSNLHRLSWGFAGAIPWAYLAVIATLIGCVVAREPKRLVVTPTMTLIGVFIICITLTSVVALAPPDLVWTKWEQVAKVFLFLLVTAALVNDRHRIHAMIWLMVISLGYYGVKGGGFTLLTGGGGRVLGPPSSMVADNNHLAAALLVAVPLMNYLRLQSAHRLIRIGLLAGMVLTLFSVVGSYSRGALVGLGAVAVVLWLRSPNKIVTAGLAAILVITALSVMPEAWMDRMMTLREADQTLSGQSRLAMWEAAWKMAVARPLTGAGFMGPYTDAVISVYAPGTVPRAVHSIWFEVLGENGFPTFFVWLSMTLVAVVNTFRIVRDVKGIPELAWCRDFARMTQISIVAYVVAGTFLSLCYWDFYLTLLVLIAATRVIVAHAARDRAEAAAPVTWRHRRILAGARAAGSAPDGDRSDLGWRPVRSGGGNPSLAGLPPIATAVPSGPVLPWRSRRQPDRGGDARG